VSDAIVHVLNNDLSTCPEPRGARGWISLPAAKGGLVRLRRALGEFRVEFLRYVTSCMLSAGFVAKHERFTPSSTYGKLEK
jgi:hypothetical protein